MRELLSKELVIVTGALIVALAALFAWRQNLEQEPPPPSARADEPDAPRPLEERGRQVYAEQRCARCHAIARVGGQSPLDGVGARLGADELQDWIVAPPRLEGEMPAYVFRAKQRYGRLSPAEIEALVAYLQGLLAGDAP